ncbi:exported hypothetical protein [Nitrospina gracilis 3/211]|uniref:Lipoprotein n=1 Tax=Nitrospina gracilis (strain 3/211) TaxID=1266370 RepID=M1YYZ2_NITG3|nr:MULTISPECIES: hypothetical protein [Nitrospina]MCF8723422.1 hypothetical protein [Nitrospina sp. Nb-3]CCQ90482.1 exported hypothetical protein [Nitrospina gracilis 3/211]
MRHWICAVLFLGMVGCATAPVNPEDVDNSMGEARKIKNKYGTGCLSLGWPEGSISYINCVLNFYQQEKPDVEDRRPVLVEALKRVTQKND